MSATVSYITYFGNIFIRKILNTRSIIWRLRMEFKKMSAEEIPDVAKLYLEFAAHVWNETGSDGTLIGEVTVADLLPELESYSNDSGRIIYVAKESGRIVGFITGEIKSYLLAMAFPARTGYVAGGYVVPEHRQHGLMKTLESMLMRFFDEHGVQQVELNVLAGSSAGKKSWEALGYRTFREQMRKTIT
jgi:GNAT superfamily N-acetyltransferase